VPDIDHQAWKFSIQRPVLPIKPVLSLHVKICTTKNWAFQSLLKIFFYLVKVFFKFHELIIQKL
jgi:hypothetical protein